MHGSLYAFPIVPPDVSKTPSRKSRLTAEHTVSAIDAFNDAIANLDHVFGTIQERYNASLATGNVQKETVPELSVSKRTQFSG